MYIPNYIVIYLATREVKGKKEEKKGGRVYYRLHHLGARLYQT